MIGPAYASRAVQAVLGPYRSQLIPATLHIGWLDDSGDLIAMSGTSITHDTFGPSGNGVANIAAIDAGVAGDGWTIHAVGLFDTPTGGDLVASADLPAPVSPTEGGPLVFGPGGLTFEVA